MSDIFDHMCDAFEREEMEQSEGNDPAFYGRHARVPETSRRQYSVASTAVTACVCTADPNRSARCKRCGCSGLHWVVDKGKYRLYGSDGLAHVCETTRNGIDRNDLYGVVDQLDDGELNELKQYCEQELAKRKDNRHGHTQRTSAAPRRRQ